MERRTGIENVGAETWRLLSRSWVFAFGLLAIVFSTIAMQLHTPYPRAWGFLFIVGVASVISVTAYFGTRVRKEFMLGFAEASGYSFSESGGALTKEDLCGALFDIGQSRKSRYVIRGEYLGSPLIIFNYSYTTQEGKNTTYHKNTVLELVFDTNLPNIFLVGKWFQRNFSIKTSVENLEFASHPQKVPLTGGFDEQFKLYAPKDYEIEALQIFDTDILEMLSEFREEGHNFAIELAENRLFIYLNGYINDTKTLREMHKMAKFLVEKLARELKIMRPGLDAQEETFRRLSRAAERRV